MIVVTLRFRFSNLARLILPGALGLWVAQLAMPVASQAAFAVKYATNTAPAQWTDIGWTDVTIPNDAVITVSGPVACAGTFTSNSMWNGEISYTNGAYWLFKAADNDAWYIKTARSTNAPTATYWYYPYGNYGPAGVRPPNAAPIRRSASSALPPARSAS